MHRAYASVIPPQDVMHQPFLKEVLKRRARELGEPAYHRIERQLCEHEQDDVYGVVYKAGEVFSYGRINDAPQEECIKNTACAVKALNYGKKKYVELFPSGNLI